MPSCREPSSHSIDVQVGRRSHRRNRMAQPNSAPLGHAHAERSRESDAAPVVRPGNEKKRPSHGEQSDCRREGRHDTGLGRREPVVPVTVLKVSPCRVVQVKTPETDGYSALQVTFGHQDAAKLNQPRGRPLRRGRRRARNQAGRAASRRCQRATRSANRSASTVSGPGRAGRCDHRSARARASPAP